MSTPIDTGGPAFPGIAGEEGHGNVTSGISPNGNAIWITHNQGMSLLDFFAAHALAAVCSGGPEDAGMYGATYIDGVTGNHTTSANHYPDKTGKPVPNRLHHSKEWNTAMAAYRLASEMLVARKEFLTLPV